LVAPVRHPAKREGEAYNEIDYFKLDQHISKHSQFFEFWNSNRVVPSLFLDLNIGGGIK
jgi:hemerythrin